MYTLKTINAVRKKPDKTNNLFSFRLSPEETVRFWEIMDRAKARSPYATKTDVIRELLGLNPLEALTAKDLAYFRGQKPNLKNKQPAPTNTVLPIARPSEVPADGVIENGLEAPENAKKRRRG